MRCASSSTNSFDCSKAAKRGRVRRRLSYASPMLTTTRKRAECGAQFLDEYGGLLKGGEMSAVGGFVPIEESRIDPLAPQSRRQKQFAGENAHGDRQIQPLRREIGRQTLIVEARGVRGRVGEPIERDVVEHLVARDFPLRFVVAVGPLAEFFVDPRRLAGGRVRQRVTDGLRPGGLYLGVTRFFVIKRDQLSDGRFLRLVRFALDRRWKQYRQIEMDRREPFYVLFGHTRRDARAPVAALREIVGVAQAPHQHRPCPRDSRQAPAALGRFVGKAKARKRGKNDMEGVFELTAVSGRVSQRTDDIEKFDNAARPAVGYDDRARMLVGRTNVQDVNDKTLAPGSILRV